MDAFVYPILANGVYDFLKNRTIFGKEHANRLFHYETYQRNVKILTERLDILEKHQNEVITMVESAKQMDKDVYPEVLEWIEKTQNDLSSYREKVKSSSQNFSDFVVHPQAMIDVAFVSKSINESIEHRIKFGDFIAHDSRFYDKDYMFFETRERALEGVMKALKDPMVKMIGLHGMGGIGKTTLAKEIARQAKKEANLFDKVIMGSAISQKPIIANIQFEIGKDLGVEFGNNETILTRATTLRKELGKKVKVLIILDDIWEEIDLFDVGIHFSDNPKGSKILFTSRHQGLYNPTVEFAVHSLDEDESTKLFTKVVGKILDENLDCSRELVKECGGLPIVINTVAAALKDASSSKWRTFLNEMRNSAPKSIEGMESKVFWSIKLSYNFLESEEAKSLLLLCSIFPEDRFISDYELVIYSVGWRSFQNVNTMGDAKDKLSTLIDTLRKHCLLLPSDESESHIRYHWVKLHDVIRDVLKSVAKEEGLFSLSKYEELPEEKHANLAVVSLLPDFETQFPDILACPNLVSFIDMSFDEKRLSDCFFAETKKLRVLKLTNVDLRSPPSSFSCLLESLEILCLTYCDLEDTTFLGSFKILKCLDLLRCRFKTLSKQVGQLTHLQSLTIGSCKYLEVIEPDVISSLINLEELYMGRVKIAWEVEKVSSERSNVSLAELKNLTRLNTLYLEIQNDTYLSKDFISRNIKSYQITVGEPDFLFADNFSSYSRVLMLELHNGNLIKECGFDKLMKECQALQLRGCEDVTIDIYVSNADGFPELEVFDLRDASNVRYLMECNHPVFQNLKKLQLKRLSNLQKMYDGELVAGSFSKLKEVQVSECHTLKSLFPVSTIAGQLEEMEVESCDMMENIVFHKNENGTHQKIEFLKLQKLVLKRLPILIQFCKLEPEQNVTTSPSLDSSPSTIIFPLFREEVVTFPILEQLRLSSLDCVEMICQDQVQELSYMQNLKDLHVEKCHKLKYLFSFIVARSLAQLKTLKVKECENMQEIIVIKEAGNEEGSSMETICFPKLEKVNLSSLSNVKTFSGGKRLAIKCPSLKILKIKECPKLKTFQKSCSNEIEAAEEPLFNEKVVSFPILEELQLWGLDSVEMIWADQLQEVSYMQNLKDLNVFGCDKLKYMFSSAVARSFIQLRNLTVEWCENMEEIVVIKEGGEEEGSSNDTISFPKLQNIRLYDLTKLKRFSSRKPLAVECEGLMKRSCRNEFEEAKLQPFFNQKVSFPMLESLYLRKLDSVEMIWADELEEVSYMQNLKDLTVWNCGKLKYVFPCAMERRLVQLRKLWITGCDNMEGILVIKEGASVMEELHLINHHHHPMALETLVIEECPKLKMMKSCRSREVVEGEDHTFTENKVVVPNFEEVSLEWMFMPSSMSFQNLREIRISEHDEMINLMNSSTARSLAQLRYITIIKCKEMRQVIVDEEEAGENVMVFLKLKTLTLHRLPNLKSFNCGNSDIQFPNLKKVIVSECPHMENFSSGNVITSNYKLAKIFTKLKDEFFIDAMHAKGIEEVWKGDLKTTVRMIWEENNKQLNEQPMKSEDYHSCSTSSSE
ncbi:probable disease resistance protein At4g27220 isoform X2 [Cannabis sativa]|uniref:probable disease resistance protein At4g27220 isoform X2 n=1 Tax=Cannabis sativa TaxID=3483 RepID=UPI0029CAA6C3|nr:probable disease resistance protein At4g27220 isoform X2 [Cannabis sativa]